MKVEKFGITNSGTMEIHEIVSLPNMFVSSDTRTLTIMINFYWKLFEQMRKRYIRPERTPENRSTNALLLELSKMDDEAIMRDQQNMVDKLEYTSLSYNFSPFKMPFQVLDQSLFKSGWNLDYFALDQNMGLTDDMLQRVFAEE